jgi:hypothetical protein
MLPAVIASFADYAPHPQEYASGADTFIQKPLAGSRAALVVLC